MVTKMTTPKSLPSPIPYHTYFGQHLDEPAIYDYVTDQAGVVMRVRTPHFYAVHRVAFGHVRGLGRWPEEGVLLSVPKIPASWLGRVLGHARRAGSGGRVALPIEQMYHFHWFHWRPVSVGGDGWRVAIPKQQASVARVMYRGGQESSVVLDLHSHHEMAAYFSRTDDGDELGARFYAVIGRIYSRPEIRLRLGLYGEFLDLPALTLFEGLGPFVDVYQPDSFETEGVEYADQL
jgi:PRTRC genetic system protein A